ncbi:MAG: hypothetical protein EOP11_27255, partial [Proteobacteria bacterium]
MPSLSHIWPLFLLLGACSTSETFEEPAADFRSFSTSDIYGKGEAPQCKLMLDAYCGSLYSPQAAGNLEVKRGLSSV